MPNQLFNDRQSRISRAFCRSSTSCSIDCACGRVHFTSAQGHGDYSDGELEGLQAKAKEQPDKYLEDWTFHSIEYMHDGSDAIVIDCPCGRAERIGKWLEDRADRIVEYLRLHYAAVKDDAEREVQRSEKALSLLNAMPDLAAEPATATTRQFHLGGRHG